VAGEAAFGQYRAEAQTIFAQGCRPAVKTAQLHLAPDRRDRFAALEPKVWLESSLIRTWVIAEPSLIIELLRDPRAVILSIDDMLGVVERNYAVAFPHVRFATRHLPLFLEDDPHAERRRSFSRYLAARLAALEASLPELVGRHLRPLRNKGSIELVSEVIGPMVREVTAILVDRPLAGEIESLDLLDLFALNKSLARFKDLERRVGQAIESLGAAEEDNEARGNRFTALVMGLETLKAMLIEGVRSAFAQEAAANGGPAVLAAHPIETGVPISYRRADADFTVAGHDFARGDLLRLQLQTLGYVPRQADRKWIFGAGIHSCVGKKASLRIWDEFKHVFDAMLTRGRISSYELAPSHYLVRHTAVHVEVF
jgi:cytochrome P450